MSDKLREAIIEKVTDSVVASSSSKNKDWLDKFNALRYNNKFDCISLIVKCQEIAIREGMLNEVDINIPKIGTLKIKPVRRALVELRQILIEQKGKSFYKDLNTQEQAEIDEQLSIKAKDLITGKKKAKQSSSPFVRIVNNFSKNNLPNKD